MSATLTWHNGGLGVKTGTTITELINDYVTLIGTHSADANFKWEVAGSNTGTSPQYLLLRRKSGSAGRIALINFSTAPAAVNAAIFQTTPTTNVLFAVWYPDGTGTTLSNIISASGTMCGVDTRVAKAVCFGAISSDYSASLQPNYFETDECIAFFFQDPLQPNIGGGGLIGDIYVDGTDTAWGGGFGVANGYWNSLATLCPWTSATYSAGQQAPYARTNHTTYSPYILGQAWSPQGSWHTNAAGLFNGSTSQVEFPPIVLKLGCDNTGAFGALAGNPLKLRQICYGPPTASAFAIYNATGPVVNALCIAGAIAGAYNVPWLVNQKN